MPRSETGSSTSNGSSRFRPGSARTTCTPTTSRPAMRWSKRASSWSASNTITPTSPPAWPSTAWPARRSEPSTTAPAMGPTARFGGRAAGRRPGRIRARRQAMERAHAGRRSGDSRAVANGLRLDGRGARRGAADPGPLQDRVGPRAWRASPRARAERPRFADHLQRRAPVRRHGRAVRNPRHRQLRGPGRLRVAGRLRRARAGRISAARDRRLGGARRQRWTRQSGAPAGWRRAARSWTRARPSRPLSAISTQALRFRRSPPASTTASPGRPQTRASIRRGGTTWSWSCSPAGSSRTGLLLERTAEAVSGAGLRVLVPLRLPPNDGGISYGQAAVAAARSRLPPAT